MLKELREHISNFLFAKAERINPFHWKNVPEEWDTHPKYKALWKKVINEESFSLMGVLIHYLEDSESLIHYHTSTQYVTVLQGEMEIILPNKKVCLKQGESLSISPKVRHYTRSQKDCIQLLMWHPASDDLTDQII